MAAFFRFWTRQAELRPFITVAATEVCLSASGDLLAQTLAMHIDFGGTSNKQATENKYDFWRTARFVLFATCVSPIGVRWHRFLDARFPIHSQSTWFKSQRKSATGRSPLTLAARTKRKAEHRHTARQVGKRLVFDQLIYDPTMYMLFFGSMALLEGGTLDDAKSRIANLLVPTYLTSLTISPLIQSINFAFVPLIYRVPFGSSFDLLWDSYLSWVNTEKLANINNSETRAIEAKDCD